MQWRKFRNIHMTINEAYWNVCEIQNRWNVLVYKSPAYRNVCEMQKQWNGFDSLFILPILFSTNCVCQSLDCLRSYVARTQCESSFQNFRRFMFPWFASNVIYTDWYDHSLKSTDDCLASEFNLYFLVLFYQSNHDWLSFNHNSIMYWYFWYTIQS